MPIDHEHSAGAVFDQLQDSLVCVSLLIVEESVLAFPEHMLTTMVIVQLFSNHLIDAVLLPLSLEWWHGGPVAEAVTGFMEDVVDYV